MTTLTHPIFKYPIPIAILVLILCAPLKSEGLHSKGALSFFFENDVFAGTDQHYTNGIMFRWLSAEIDAEGSGRPLPLWFQRLVRTLSPRNDKEYKHAFSASLGQKIFTPEDISQTEPGPEAQPYAGVTYMEVGIQSRSLKRLDSYVLSLGIIGEHSYAGSLQVLIHRLFKFTTPMGWESQLKDEFIFNMYYETISRRARMGGTEGFGLDVFTDMGAGVGNGFVGAGGGLMLRTGWNLPMDFGPSLMLPRGEALFAQKKLAVTFFSAFNASYVLHDIVLDGTFNTDIPLPPRKSIYGEISAGIEIYSGRFKIVWSGVLWNKRLRTQLRPHIYGSINLSYCF